MASMYPVMPVLKTTSPAIALDTPDEEPENSVPSSRTSFNGSEQRVDEWRYGRSLRQNNQRSEQYHYYYDWCHPELFAYTHECPKILHQIQHQNGLSIFFAGIFSVGTR